MIDFSMDSLEIEEITNINLWKLQFKNDKKTAITASN
jgi:hypothetical protein